MHHKNTRSAPAKEEGGKERRRTTKKVTNHKLFFRFLSLEETKQVKEFV
jgi:hypothetical protein